MLARFAGPAGGLLRQPDFLRLWTGQTISRFGSYITGAAVELAALIVLGATPAQMGLLAAAISAPVLVFGLVAGVWVDRVRRRPLMIAADLVRTALLLTIPLAALTGQLRMAQLFIVAPLVGILSVFFDVAHQSYVPTLVGREQVVEANSRLGLSGSLAEVTGTGIAGVLVQFLGAPVAILIDAASFIVSAGLLAGIRTPEPAPAPRQAGANVSQELTEGIRYILARPILRALAFRDVTSSFFGNFFAGLYALYCLRDLGMSPALIGLSVAAGGVGNLLGALVTQRVTRRFGIGPTILAVLAVSTAISLLIPLAGGPLIVAAGMVFAAQFINDGFHAAYDITNLSVRQAATPDALLGRVNGAVYLLVAGFGPFGAAAGGLIAESLGARSTLLIAVLVGSLGGLWIVFSPVATLRSLPELPLE
jgi:MFS family permease